MKIWKEKCHLCGAETELAYISDGQQNTYICPECLAHKMVKGLSDWAKEEYKVDHINFCPLLVGQQVTASLNFADVCILPTVKLNEEEEKIRKQRVAKSSVSMVIRYLNGSYYIGGFECLSAIFIQELESNLVKFLTSHFQDNAYNRNYLSQ